MSCIIIKMNQFENNINAIRNILRTEGITGMDSINHNLIFTISRYLDKETCIKLGIDTKYSFESLMALKNDENALYERFYNKKMNCLVGQIRDKMKFKCDFKLEGTGNLVTILDKMNTFDIKNTGLTFDIVGTIYEIHLKSGTSQAMRDLGQYFTSRRVIKYMVELCNPTVKADGSIETILDPTMGTAGFLTMAIKHINTFHNTIDWAINKKHLIGFDIDEHVKNMAILNMFLETGENCEKTMCKRDTLKDDFILDDKTFVEKVDVILANEPFGIKSLIYAKNCCERIKSLKINGTKAEPLFLQLMMQSLKENGRAAVIVPNGVLFNDANLHTSTRKYLIENLNLMKVISLNGDFFLNTGVKSSILFFANNGKTKEVEFCDIVMKESLEEVSIIKVCYDNIVANNYNLFVNKYNKLTSDKIEGIKYMKLGDVCNFLSKSKRQASFGKDEGKYPFYTSSKELTKYCNINDYTTEALIIGTGGNANIKINSNFSCSADNFVVSSNEQNCMNKYIYYYFLTNINKLEECFHGSTIKHLSKSDLEKLEIPIPSLTTQQSIVDALDQIYGQIERNNASIKTYEQLKKAIVWANTQNGCEEKKLGEVCSDIKTGKNKPTDNKTGTMYPYYGTGGITGYTDEFLVDGKYILTARNGTIGQTIFIEGKSYPSDHMFIIKNTTINIKYIFYYLLNLSNLEQYAVGTTIKGISKESLNNSLIKIPSSTIQQKIVEECKYFDNMIETLKTQNDKLVSMNIICSVLQAEGQITNTIEQSDTIALIADEDSESEIVQEVKPKKSAKKVTLEPSIKKESDTIKKTKTVTLDV